MKRDKNIYPSSDKGVEFSVISINNYEEAGLFTPSKHECLPASINK